jgi:VWFA-related protein
VTVIPRRAPFWIGAISLVTYAALGFGNQDVATSVRSRPPAPRVDFRLESNLVLVPVSVTDARNHAITDLGRDAFHIYEDKAEQAIVQFVREDAPLSVGIVFDASDSMTGKLDKSREAMKQFLHFANPEDEFFLVEFNNRARLAVPFTQNTGDIQNHLLQVQPKGTTALLDAVWLAMDSLQHARYARRALLILSDGGDNHSRHTESAIRNRVRESDLWIYTIGIAEHRPGDVAKEVLDGPKLLAGLAEDSGGRHFTVDSLVDLPVVAARIGVELRNQYVLGYRPSDARRDGKYHALKVDVASSNDLRVSWRPGYYGAAQ